ALFLWIVCAAVLRAVLAAGFSPVSVYGSLAAPIALLLWLYITALAVLIGAILNAEVDRLWPGDGRTKRIRRTGARTAQIGAEGSRAGSAIVGTSRLAQQVGTTTGEREGAEAVRLGLRKERHQ